jgi:hypothetical protein
VFSEEIRQTARQFEEAAPVKKPGKKASPEEKKASREALKKQDQSVEAVQMFRELRQKVDLLGDKEKTFWRRLLLTADSAIADLHETFQICHDLIWFGISVPLHFVTEFRGQKPESATTRK